MGRSVLCAVALLLAAHTGVAYDFPKFGGEVKNVLGASKVSPFANALRQIRAAKDVYSDLKDWFEAVSKDVATRRQTTDGSECTLRGQEWIEDAVRYTENRRIVPPDKSCATRTEHIEKSDLRKAFSLTRRLADVSEEAGKEVVATDKAVQVFWNNMTARTAPRGVFGYKNLMYESDRQECTLNYAAAMKTNGSWYIFTAITSANIGAVGPSRDGLVEHVQFEFKPSLPMLLKTVESNRSAENPYTEKFSTWFEQNKGAARISRLTNMRFDENRALSAALDANLLAVDQANDALTKSNFAILILPLTMAFIPVALIADVSDAATFFYVLLTDVFSAVPFVIKGIELVQTGTQTIRNAETWLVGETNSREVAETWAASCQPDTYFRTVGLIVILVGLGAIALGIFIEYVARKYMGIRRENGEHPEPLGPALLRMEPYIPVGANYVPYDADYDDPLAPNMAADMPPPPPAAGGPAPSRFTALFSGLINRRPMPNWFRRAREREEASEGEGEDAARAADNTGFSNFIGVMRRRSNAQTPERGAEYEDVV